MIYNSSVLNICAETRKEKVVIPIYLSASSTLNFNSKKIEKKIAMNDELFISYAYTPNRIAGNITQNFPNLGYIECIDNLNDLNYALKNYLKCVSLNSLFDDVVVRTLDNRIALGKITDQTIEYKTFSLDKFLDFLDAEIFIASNKGKNEYYLLSLSDQLSERHNDFKFYKTSKFFENYIEKAIKYFEYC